MHLRLYLFICSDPTILTLVFYKIAFAGFIHRLWDELETVSYHHPPKKAGNKE